MMLESSPAIKKGAQEAIKRMFEGKYDKTPTREETDARMAARKKERAMQLQEQTKRDAANLPELEKQHAEMEAIHEKGKNWQYADREQNMSENELRARDIAGRMNDLGNRISAVKRNTSSYAKGGKISLGDCGTSTATKGMKNSNW
jgi:TATA-binding protein-associated factor Taf7